MRDAFKYGGVLILGSRHSQRREFTQICAAVHGAVKRRVEFPGGFSGDAVRMYANSPGNYGAALDDCSTEYAVLGGISHNGVMPLECHVRMKP